MKEEIAQKYLEGLLKFKAKKDFHSEFVPLKKRQQLLKELALDLGFSKEIWKTSRQVAKNHFIAYELLKQNDGLKDKLPKVYAEKIINELKQAIDLDPYNEEYLKTYVSAHYGIWTPDIDLKKRYLNLFNPASAEYTEVMVELGLSINNVDSEFLDDKVTGPFINALVFLRDHPKETASSLSEKDIKQLNDLSGLDKNELKELSSDVKGMLDTLHNTINNHWLTVKDMHKAVLVVDRLVSLAPSDPTVLHAAIYFYGHSLWRFCLNSLKVKSTPTDLKAFYGAYLGIEKPNSKQKLDAAISAFEKAKHLEQQFMKLPAELFKEPDKDDWRARFMQPSSFKIRQIMHGQRLSHSFIKTFMTSEQWNFDQEKRWYEFSRKNTIFGIVSGIILMLICALLCYLNDWSYMLLVNFSIVPFFAAFGLTYLREMWWKNKLKYNG